MNVNTAKEVIDFWFGDLNEENGYSPSDTIQKQWWQKSKAFDDSIRERFLDSIFVAAKGAVLKGIDDKDRLLATVILLDQFTRNVFRDSGFMYAYDTIALTTSLKAIEDGMNQLLHPIQRVFIYMPLEHNEDIHVQNQCVELFKSLENQVDGVNKSMFTSFTSFAIKHQEIIERFGRFPHRNALLGRASTPAEKLFLQQPNSGF